MRAQNLSEMNGLGEPVTQTVALMESVAAEWSSMVWTQKLARDIVGRAGARTPQAEAEAVWSWIRSRVKYREDPVGAEWIQSPFTTAVEAMAGDCDDQAVLAAALLMALGHAAKPVAVHWKGREWPSHAVVEDMTAGCIVDPCTRPPKTWPPKEVAYLVRP